MGNFCPSCLTENADGALICAICGGDMNLKNKPHQLPAITILNAKYLIGKAGGEDDSGITYAGLDLSSNQKVVIKEFYPAGIVSRNSGNSLRVEAINDDNEFAFKRDREKFVAEAMAKSRADKDSSHAHVRDAFYENSTSYIVMDYTEISDKAEPLPERAENNPAEEHPAEPEEKPQPQEQNAAPQPAEQPKQEPAQVNHVDLKKEPAPTEAKATEKAAEKDTSKDAPKECTPKRKTPVWLIAAAICLCALAVFFVVTKVVLPNNNYNAAVALMDEGKYEEAIAAFKALDGYKDSAEQIEICKQNPLENAQVGDYITFGSYEQDNDTSNGAEDIEWLVLDKQDNKILVISKYALDAKPYNKGWVDITWEKCTLRSWLNGDFYNAAFSADEKQYIALTSVSADENPEYSTDSGNDTTDNVFLLSITEAEKYFSSDTSRQCAATDYAIAQGADTNSDYTVDDGFSCWWWLRSPGYNQRDAARVCSDGSVFHFGYLVYLGNVCVRPALWINLDSFAESANEQDIAENTVTAPADDSTDFNANDLKSAQIGDYITFGAYEQDNDTASGAEEIEWLVLDKQDDKILVISKYGLDARQYNTELKDTTWENCMLRSWLNGDFYNAAFSADEKQYIAQTSVSADKNPKYSTDPGNDTTDNVFLLSITEAEKYFSSDTSRQCAATDYAIAQGAYTNSDYTVDDGFSCWWWLRSPGRDPGRAAFVSIGGSVAHFGSGVDYAAGCVRPALWINLDS